MKICAIGDRRYIARQLAICIDETASSVESNQHSLKTATHQRQHDSRNNAMTDQGMLIGYFLQFLTSAAFLTGKYKQVTHEDMFQ